MRVLIAGANGQLGQDLQKAFSAHTVTALGRAQLDVTDRDVVVAAIAGHDAVVNASAYTKVDDAEAHEDEAYAINALGTENLAVAAAVAGARYVTVSTDYVFDGHATEPYAEDTPRDPINAYGRTKAAGEELALAAHPDGTYVVRTAWLYGAGGANFARTMVKLAATHETVSVVADQLGPADLDRRPRRPDRRFARVGCSCRRLPRHEFGPGQLVRVREGGLQRGRIEP